MLWISCSISLRELPILKQKLLPSSVGVLRLAWSFRSTAWIPAGLRAGWLSRMELQSSLPLRNRGKTHSRFSYLTRRAGQSSFGRIRSLSHGQQRVLMPFQHRTQLVLKRGTSSAGDLFSIIWYAKAISYQRRVRRSSRPKNLSRQAVSGQ
ncbi:hypothetical protein D9M70_554670 [compost metagenome]